MEQQKDMAGINRDCRIASAVQKAEELEALVSCSFGPGGRAALIQQPTGQLTVTRSGWAILKAVHEDSNERFIVECAGQVENSLGDGVKCFIFTLAALLRNLQQLQRPRNHLITQLMKLQLSLAQLNFLDHVVDVSSTVIDHCIKITSAYFITRFPALVSSALKEVFHNWLVSYLTTTSDDILTTLQYLYRNFAVLCLYQNLGPRSVSDSCIVSGFLVSRPAVNLTHSGQRMVKILPFDDRDSDIDCQVKDGDLLRDSDIDCQVKDGDLLVTSHILSDLLLFKFRKKDIAVLHGVLRSELEFLSSVLTIDMLVEVKTVFEGSKKCTWLNLPQISHLVLCGPTEALSGEYAAACLGVLRLLLNTAGHSTLVQAGGCFERTLHFELISKLGHCQRLSVFSVTNRTELLQWHHHQTSKTKENKELIIEELTRIADVLCCVEDDVLLAFAGALLAVPRKLAAFSHQQAFESLAFKVQVIEHVVAAAVQILRVGSIINISRKVPHR